MLEKEREEKIAKERQHQKEVMEKAQKEEEELKRKTAEAIAQKIEVAAQKRENYYKDLQDRLAEHVSDTWHFDRHPVGAGEMCR